MPNEQTSVPLYAASEILTAANMNISAGTGVPVFATTVTRDAAFGGASEKVLAEGQLCYLSSTNVVQYYDGAAWATVGPAAASGLTFISGASFSAVASVSLPANTFSATYTDYLIFIRISSATDAELLEWRGRTSGTDNTTSNYQASFIAGPFTAAAPTNHGPGVNQSFAVIMFMSSADANTSVLTVRGPQAATPTNIAHNGTGANNAGVKSAIAGAGYFTATTSFDSLTLFPGSGTITGSYKVYGYGNS